jgi:hypothetical protein
MTPNQIALISKIHNEVNNPDENKSNRTNKTGDSNNHILDADDPKSAVMLAELSSMKLPAKR